MHINSIPIKEIGFLANLNRPINPRYFEQQPADHTRAQYSAPKKITKHTS